ncbi:uncharacterized protein LOC119506066 [Choloepus didactylus]|uniref:uncharacterized protein LOC119506066 n=1 Tax=Choloepus didactylus TaxID=27675 RepID=UPI0018A00D7B|nr:uncharacterized protein LOC119506066 [Choloepus didactylus]
MSAGHSDIYIQSPGAAVASGISIQGAVLLMMLAQAAAWRSGWQQQVTQTSVFLFAFDQKPEGRAALGDRQGRLYQPVPAPHQTRSHPGGQAWPGRKGSRPPMGGGFCQGKLARAGLGGGGSAIPGVSPLHTLLPPSRLLPSSAGEERALGVSWLALWLLPRKEEALSADQFISWLSCAGALPFSGDGCHPRDSQPDLQPFQYLAAVKRIFGLCEAGTSPGPCLLIERFGWGFWFATLNSASLILVCDVSTCPTPHSPTEAHYHHQLHVLGRQFSARLWSCWSFLELDLLEGHKNTGLALRGCGLCHGRVLCLEGLCYLLCSHSPEMLNNFE